MFGLLMKDNTPVDFPFRRSGRGSAESVSLGRYGHQQLPAGPRMGFVPGGPYFPQRRVRYGIPPSQAVRVPQYSYVPGGPYYPRMGFVPGGPYYPRGRGGFSGFVDESGYEHPDVVPGTGTTKEADSTSWTSLGTSALNLGTSIVNAIAGSINPQSGAAGAYCPSGYYLNNGRCVPLPTGGSSISPTMVMGGLALVGAAIFFSRKRG